MKTPHPETTHTHHTHSPIHPPTSLQVYKWTGKTVTELGASPLLLPTESSREASEDEMQEGKASEDEMQEGKACSLTETKRNVRRLELK